MVEELSDSALHVEGCRWSKISGHRLTVLSYGAISGSSHLRDKAEDRALLPATAVRTTNEATPDAQASDK